MNIIGYPNLSLIVAEVSQVEEIRELVNSSYSNFFNDFLESSNPENVRLKGRQDVVHLIEDNNYELYVLIDKVTCSIFGTIVYVPNGEKKSAWFGLFSLTPSLRGTTVGKQMVEYMEHLARVRGKVKMKLDVSGFALPLQLSYQKMGYKKTDKTIPFSQNIHWTLKQEYQDSSKKDFLVFSKVFS